MSGRLRFEAWTLPTSATFELITPIEEVLGGSGTVEMSDYVDGRIEIAATWGHLADVVPSLIRVYDGTNLVDEFLAQRVSKPTDRGGRVVSGPQINGIAEKLAIYPYNYPDDFPEAQDWIWGGENQLPDLGLGDLGNINETWELWNDQTPGGTFTLAVEYPAATSDTTNSLDFDATTNQIEGSVHTGNGLQGLTNVNDVHVSGSGTQDDPWVIVFHDPPDPTTVSVTDTGLTSTLTKTEEGTLDPSPVTQSQTIDAAVEVGIHGLYGEPPIEVVTNNLDTGADWALKVNAEGRFAGSQIVVNVNPGQIYQASIRVKSTVNGTYVLVIRDRNENLIAQTSPRDVPLTAGSYQTLTVSDIVIPPGVNEVIIRVAVTDESSGAWATHYVNWQGAEFREGQAEATPGQIVRELVEAGQARNAFEFLDLDFSDTVDTNGGAWPSELSFTAFFGANASLAVVMADLDEMGYPWRIVAKATPSGSLTHDLRLYAAKPGGTDLTASAGGPSVLGGGDVTRGAVIERIPNATAMLAHGFEGLRLEDTDASGITAVGRWEQIVDAEHLATAASLQEFLDDRFAEQASNATAAEATVLGTDQDVPLVDYQPGDTIWWQFPGILDKEARSVRQISWSVGEPAVYTLHGSRVFTDEGALAAAVDKLLRAFLRRRRRGKGGTPSFGGGGGAPTVVVAPANSSALSKSKADFVCSGTDDHDTLNMAKTEGGPRARVLLTEGTLDVDPNQFFLDDDQHLQGMGRHATTIRMSASAGSAVILGSRSTVSDLQFFIGSSVSGTIAIETASGVDPTIRDCGFVGFQIAIEVNANRTTITRCAQATGGTFINVIAGGLDRTQISDCIASGGIVLGDAQNVGISNCVLLTGNAVPSISMAGAFAVRIANCYIEPSGQTALDLGNLSSHIWITNNWVFANGGTAIALNSTSYVFISNSYIQGFGGPALFSFGTNESQVHVDNCHLHSDEYAVDAQGNGTWQFCTIANTFITSGFGGMIFDAATDCKIHHCIIEQPGQDAANTYDGITLVADSDRNMIDHNTIRSGATSARYGINIAAASCDNNIVVGNDYGASASYGTGPYNDGGTGTRNTYPNDATLGDNFAT